MASLMELVERVNKGELIDSGQLEVYEDSSNSAEKFLAHHAHAMLELRTAQQHMLQSLEAIDYSDQKVLNQFVAISGFLGLTDLRTRPVVKFGSCAIARREYALGIEAIASAVAFDLQHGGTYTSERENCLFVAAQYERAAEAAGWSSGGVPLDHGNQQLHIGLIVSNIADEEAATRAIAGLAKNYDASRFRLHVYSTEAGVRREKQSFAPAALVGGSAKRGHQTLEILGQKKIPTWICPADTDLLTAAKDLAHQIIRDRIDVLLIDASQADAIAAVIGNWDVARAKINTCRRTPLYSGGIDAITYTDRARFEADREYWSRRGVEARFLLEGINLDEIPASSPNRAAYGIPENAVVLATAGQDLDRSISEEFVESIVSILRSNPQTIYLLIGEGDLGWQKRKFESAGVGKRIGYAGRRKDLPAFLRIADVYLAEFPATGTGGILQAMSVERPVVTMAIGDAAHLVGAEVVVNTTEPTAFIDRVSWLVREAPQRINLGRAMRQRVEQQFAYSQTARGIEQLCEQTIQRARQALHVKAQAA